MQTNESVERKRYVVDATELVLGRMATDVAVVLKGKHKPTYTPHIDGGDYVIVVNADKVAVTGNKLKDKKYYKPVPNKIEQGFVAYQNFIKNNSQ